MAEPPERLTLETERLVLEPVSPAHAEGLYAAIAASQAELLPWMPWAREPSLAAAIVMTQRTPREWLEDHEFHFALVDKATRLVLGIVGLNREQSRQAELHYWIRTDHAGKGLTTEAAGAVVSWARQALGLKRITLWAGRDNQASRRVAEKLGFKHLGPLDWRPEGGEGHFDAESYELSLSP
ncbi:MAG TPA: GNAT family N-acetyltransferase [Patescibacteria group bacterium]|nr:GNAT family N-acetyltransferase [Patescibacteria group bacterium]